MQLQPTDGRLDSRHHEVTSRNWNGVPSHQQQVLFRNSDEGVRGETLEPQALRSGEFSNHSIEEHRRG
jgi:hypothetical protein